MPSVVPARGLRNGRVLAGGGAAVFVVYDVVGRWRGFLDYFLQNAGDKRARVVKISRRPSSMHTVSTARPKAFTASKLSEAPTCPNPGPTTFSVAATAVAEENGSSSGWMATRKVPRTKIAIQAAKQAEDGHPHAFWEHPVAYPKGGDRPRVHHPKDILEDCTEDDDNPDHLYSPGSGAGAASDEHEEDQRDLGSRLPRVEVRGDEPRRGDDARHRERRVPECPERGVGVTSLEDQHAPNEEDRERYDRQVS